MRGGTWSGMERYGDLVCSVLSGDAGAVLGGALVRAIQAKRDDRYRTDEDSVGPEEPVRVGVVVPARNEERHVGVLVEPILRRTTRTSLWWS